MSEPTCATCRWWESAPGGTTRLRVCWSDARAAQTEQGGMALWTSPDFGCNQHAPRPVDWRAVALVMRECLTEAIGEATRADGAPGLIARWTVARDACPAE